MATRTHEQTINTALGELLQDLGRYWTVRSEHVGRIFEEGGRPDILIEKADGWPIVVNCAAYTDVDGAEAHEDEATRINGVAVELLGEVCSDTGARLVHYSTDYVFNGQRDWAPAMAPPYRCDEPRDPVNVFGR